MTREEAIQWLKNEKWKNANNKYKKEWNEAFDVAISALQTREHYDKALERLFELYDMIEEALNVKLTEQVTSKLKNPCDSLLTEDSEDSKEQKSKLEHDREWIIGCIKHDGFIKTDRFDKANQIILEALSEPKTIAKAIANNCDLISRADVHKVLSLLATEGGKDAKLLFSDAHESVDALPSADAVSDDLIIKGAKGIQDGLYNIKDGELFKYKAKGGKVRAYPIVPSADAVQGEWLYVENEPYSECSKCGRYIDDLDEDKYAYCPYCGARMKGGAE